MSAIAVLAEKAETFKRLDKLTGDYIAQADSIRVTSPESRGAATEFLRNIRALREAAEEHHRPIIKAAFDAHKVATAALRKIDDPLVAAETKVKRLIGSYDFEQERLRREEQHRLEAEARRRREEEALAAAEAAHQAGATEAEADAVLEETLAAPIEVTAPMPAAPVNTGGVNTRKNYKAQVVDLGQLLEFVLKTPEMRHLVKVDEPALNSLARVQKELFNVPGCRVQIEANVAVR